MNATLSERQLAIMNLVFLGAPAGGFIDIGNMMERLEFKATKQALQCSIRILEKHGLVERSYGTRGGRRRMLIGPTTLAFEFLRGKSYDAEDLIEPRA